MKIPHVVASSVVIDSEPLSRYLPSAGDDERVWLPTFWSFEAKRLLISKYFRRAGVPNATVRVFEAGIPEQFQRSVPAPGATLGGEISVWQVVDRIVGCWTYWGLKLGYFTSERDAVSYFEAMKWLILSQRGAPNSPQWFNTGLHWAYGIDAPGAGHWYCDPSTGEPVLSTSAYERPQPSACFILGLKDDLVRDGGIMDLQRRETTLFKFGSGAGSNFSVLRAKNEPLSGGGVSSGLMGWLKISDRSAAAIQSGGTTRRAAKMVVVDDDHPEIQDFVLWKTREEYKVADLVLGSAILDQTLSEVYAQAHAQDARLFSTLERAVDEGVPRVILQHAVDLARHGEPWRGVERMTTDWQGEAYLTVSGQQSNNSVRLSDAFLRAAEAGEPWDLKARVSGKTMATISASTLMDDIAWAVWTCGDPGFQFSDTIQSWNAVSSDALIRASNPCGEYLHLDDTACNLASMNLDRYVISNGLTLFDLPTFLDHVRLWTITLDISVSMAQYPSKEIAIGSWKYRSLGLGYANVATLLTRLGLGYDTEQARRVLAFITSHMTAEAWRTSCDLASALGEFPRFEANRSSVTQVLLKHQAAHAEAEFSSIWHHFLLPLAENNPWNHVVEACTSVGARNSHVTCIAPTGTIGLVMDCDTTGIEPDYALVKLKEYAGGGTHLFVSSAISSVLLGRGYSGEQVADVLKYVVGTRELPEELLAKLTPLDLEQAQGALSSAMSLDEVVSPETRSRLPEVAWSKIAATMLGHGTLAFAPHVRASDVQAFRTAKEIAWIDHVRMVAAVQTFVSGGISKSVNLPRSMSVSQIREAIFTAWKLGVKAITFYRDGSKLSQPLASFDVNVSEPAPEPESAPSQLEVAQSEGRSGVEALDRTEPILQKSTSKPDPKFVVRYLSRRRRLPNCRRGYTQKVVIDSNKIFLHTGEYEDGTLGEIFIDMHKQGATMSGLMAAFATSVSLGLQHGVPLEKFVDLFAHQTFEPNGMVQGDQRISMCDSIIDYLFRHLAVRYLGRDDMAHVTSANVRLSPPDEPWEDEQTAERALDEVGSSHLVRPPEPKVVSKDGPKEAPKVEPLQGLVGGYAGICPECKRPRLVQNGTCKRCTACGATTGCS